MKTRKNLHNELVQQKGNIRVYCRIRPLIGEEGKEKKKENASCLDKDDDGVVLVNHKGTTKKFVFERVFPPISTQEQVWKEIKGRGGGHIEG